MLKSFLTVAALGALAVAPVMAHAETMVAPAPAAAPAEAAASAAAESAADAAAAVVETTLKDGTKVMIEGDSVSVVGADGAKMAAPDGEHELADGTKVMTKDGKVVKPEAAMPEAH
jgi:hypothetical protein